MWLDLPLSVEGQLLSEEEILSDQGGSRPDELQKGIDQTE